MIDVLRAYSWTPEAWGWRVGQLNMCQKMVIVGAPTLLPPILFLWTPKYGGCSTFQN